MIGCDDTPHSLRHWYGTQLQERHGDSRLTQTLLRHSSLTSTQIYTRVSDARKHAAGGGVAVAAAGTARGPGWALHDWRPIPACSCSTCMATLTDAASQPVYAGDADAPRAGGDRRPALFGGDLDSFTLRLLEPARARASGRSRRASSTCCTCSASARWRSRSAATRRRPEPVVHTIRASARHHAAVQRARAGRRASACAARSARAWPVDGGARPRRGDRRRRHRAAPRCGRRSTTCCCTGRDYGRVMLLYGARTPRDLLYAKRAARVARPLRRSTVEVTVDRATMRLARRRRRRDQARRSARRSTPAARWRSSAGPR